MSQEESRSRWVLVTVVAVALAVAVVLLVVSLQRNQIGDGGPVAVAAASSDPTKPSGAPTDPDPNEDINSLPTPSESVAPADKSTMKPPDGDGPTFDPQRDFETGLFNGTAPTASINFNGDSYWSGYVDGTPISVYGGYAGYEHPDDGAVYVVVVTPTGGISPGGMQVLKGVGALKVVEGTNDGSVILVNQRGQSFEYGLKSQELRPSG